MKIATMTRIATTLLALVITGAGCGTSSPPPGVDGGADAGGTSFDGGAEVDGGATLDASGPTSVTSAQLFPMAVGSKWTFEVTMTTEKSLCSDGVHVSEIVGSDFVLERDSYLHRGYCSGKEQHFAYGPTGLDVFIEADSVWLPLMKDPVVDGMSWLVVGTTTKEWQFTGTVVVPAGTFHNCWTVVDPDGATMTLAPGIGPVIMTGVWSPNRAELISYEPGTQ